MRWGRLGWVTAAATTGCTVTLDPPVLRVEPAAIELAVDLAQPPPSVALRVFTDTPDGEITAYATFTLDGRPLGAFDGARFVSDGLTGGTALITVAAEGSTATVPVSAIVRGRRLVDGVPADAPAWFGAAQDVAVEVPLDPGDGSVLPPNLGGLDVDFGADDADDVHEVAVTGAFLDLRAYASGAPGSRHVALTPEEWDAITRTAGGDGVELAVRSMRGGDTVARRTSAGLAIADLDVSALVFSGLPVDAAGTPTAPPALYRYDPRGARIEPLATAAAGGCIGCHVSVSPDGKRIAASGTTGVIVDPATRQVIAMSDTATPWTTSVFDPSGPLITSHQQTGLLLVRDPNTAAVRATIPLAEPAAAPAISPDGHLLAYAVLESAGDTFVGTALHVRAWDAATVTVGPPVELVRGGGVMTPLFSPDGAWIAYSRTTSPLSAVTQGIVVVRADGGAPPVELAAGTDGAPRFASPIAPARAGGSTEPMGWMAFASKRPVGSRSLVGNQKQIWVAAFYPERGVLTRPIRLPGQSLSFSSLHAPSAVP